ncbi:MAG TPA: YbjN domain-containing protein [Chitinophagales bacterium]|nr:YbjN domain-containing protein [Chitinophagales bacterium]
MSNPQQVLDYVKEFIKGVGIDPATCWNAQNQAYYLYKGSARIELFISSHAQPDGSTRHFLRIFSGLMLVPTANREKFYRRCLEVSDQSLGVKLTVRPDATPDNDWLYATYERDISGMDFDETKTCIEDMALWSDWLDDTLQKEFTAAGPSINQ